MAYLYPYGDTQQLNLDWLIEQWNEVKSQIDGSLQAEIDRVEAAITDLLTARDEAVAAQTAAQASAQAAAGSASTASGAASTATAQAQAAAASAATAGAHASDAQQYMLTADQYAQAAQNSAGAAANSANTANGAKQDAQIYAQQAAGSAQNAQGSAVAAQQQFNLADAARQAAQGYASDAADSAQEAQDILDSIPEDYTDLSNDVSQLQTTVDDIKDTVIDNSIEELFFVNRSIYDSTGLVAGANNQRLITERLLQNSLLSVSASTGYQFILYGYEDSKGTYIGAWNGSEFVKSTVSWSTYLDTSNFRNLGVMYYRLLVRAAGNTQITPEEGRTAITIVKSNVAILQNSVYTEQELTWANYAITDLTGNTTARTNRLTQISPIKNDFDTVAISESYQMVIYGYTASSYLGAWQNHTFVTTNISWGTNEIDLKEVKQAGADYIRILIRHSDNTDIAPSEGNTAITLIGNNVAINKYNIEATQAIIAPVLTSRIADTALVPNDFRIVDNTLYRITTNIASGATLIPNTNCTVIKIADILKLLLS